MVLEQRDEILTYCSPHAALMLGKANEQALFSLIVLLLFVRGSNHKGANYYYMDVGMSVSMNAFYGCGDGSQS